LGENLVVLVVFVPMTSRSFNNKKPFENEKFNKCLEINIDQNIASNYGKNKVEDIIINMVMAITTKNKTLHPKK